MPQTTAPRSVSDLSGRYSNFGWVHSPDENHAIEAYLDVVLGAAIYPERHQGAIVLRADEDKIVVSRVEGDRVSRETTLQRDRDYRVTPGGIEMTRVSKGPGGEGVFYMKIATRILVRVRENGSLVLEAYEDGHAMALWPYQVSRVVWYEFEKEANQTSQRNAMARPISVFEGRSSRG
jgi:hypothetical protein